MREDNFTTACEVESMDRIEAKKREILSRLT